MGGGGQLALNQLLIVMDGVDNPPFFRRVFTSKINQLLDALYTVPVRVARALAPRAEAEAAQGPDLLHRRDERPDRAARPRADAPGPDGPPRLVPHADEAGPARHLRAVHQEGRARPGARPARAARRDRAHHVRLLARDDRAGLLARADVRAPRGTRRVRVAAPRRGDGDARIGHGDRRRLRPDGNARRRDPRGRPRSRGARVQEGPRVDASVDPHARRLARTPPGARQGGAFQPLPQRGDRHDHLGARVDGGRAGVLRRDDERRRRRPLLRDGLRGLHGRRLRHGARADRAERPRPAQRPAAQAP